METEKLTYSVQEAAQQVGLSRNSTYEGRRTGEIPSIKVEKCILIPRRTLENLLASSGRPKNS